MLEFLMIRIIFSEIERHSQSSQDSVGSQNTNSPRRLNIHIKPPMDEKKRAENAKKLQNAKNIKQRYNDARAPKSSLDSRKEQREKRKSSKRSSKEN